MHERDKERERERERDAVEVRKRERSGLFSSLWLKLQHLHQYEGQQAGTLHSVLKELKQIGDVSNDSGAWNQVSMSGPVTQ